jgi:hypothetical protein
MAIKPGSIAATKILDACIAGPDSNDTMLSADSPFIHAELATGIPTNKELVDNDRNTLPTLRPASYFKRQFAQLIRCSHRVIPPAQSLKKSKLILRESIYTATKGCSKRLRFVVLQQGGETGSLRNFCSEQAVGSLKGNKKFLATDKETHAVLYSVPQRASVVQESFDGFLRKSRSLAATSMPWSFRIPAAFTALFLLRIDCRTFELATTR